MFSAVKLLSMASSLAGSVPMMRLAEEAEESSLLSPDQLAHYLVTGLITIVNLLVVYLFLKFVLFKPMIKVINGRKEAISKAITDAEEKEKKAAENLEESIKRVDASHEEAMQIIADARTQAEKQSETIIETSRKEAQDIRDRAEEDAKRTRKAMLEEMKDEVADLAVSIAGHVMSSCDSNADEATLRAKAKEELNKSPEVTTGE